MEKKYEIKNQGAQKVKAIAQKSAPKKGKVTVGKDLRCGKSK